MNESRFHRIIFNISQHVFIMFTIADEAIKILALPELALAPEELVRFVCGVSFP